MKKIIFLSVLIVCFFVPHVVYAQENENSSETTTKYFDINLVREGQSAWNKAVTYTVYVTPKIDSPKTQIIWDAPTAIVVNPRNPEFVDMYRDQSYSFKATIKPKQEGSYEISVNLIAWQYDTNYSNSVSDIITFNSNLVTTPIEQGYTLSLIAKYLIIALMVGVLAWLSIIYGKKGMASLKKWLTPPT